MTKRTIYGVLIYTGVLAFALLMIFFCWLVVEIVSF